MAVQIGRKPESSFAEPLGLLTDCHRRIEHFLGVLARLAEQVHGGELNEEHRRALSTALKYFREAAPKHTADEERSLFPRLRAAGGSEVEAALAEVERLEADHVRADRLHREVDELGGGWLRDGTLPASYSERLLTLLEELRSIYSAHIAVEDNHVFPLAARVLGGDEKQAIGREMAARRLVAVPPQE